jgi:hypothetical protein
LPLLRASLFLLHSVKNCGVDALGSLTAIVKSSFLSLWLRIHALLVMLRCGICSTFVFFSSSLSAGYLISILNLKSKTRAVLSFVAHFGLLV